MIRHQPSCEAGRPVRGVFPGGVSLRRAVTLIEVMLVLAILTSLSALAYPSVAMMLEQLAMDEAVSPVRIHLAKTRIRALDAGVTWQFRFEPGGRRYVAVPYEFDEIEGDEQQQQSQLEMLPRVSGQLPEGFSFVSADLATSGTEALDEQAVAGLVDQRQVLEASWSPPLLFFSDGTSQNASFDIVNEQNQSRRLSLRSLTGSVTLRDPNGGSNR